MVQPNPIPVFDAKKIPVTLGKVFTGITYTLIFLTQSKHQCQRDDPPVLSILTLTDTTLPTSMPLTSKLSTLKIKGIFLRKSKK